MALQLTQKEQMLLKDMLHHEDLCVKKYANYAQQAQDQQLKQLFSEYQSKEQQHYDTISQMLQGQVPSMVQGGQQQQQQQGQQQQMAQSPMPQQQQGQAGFVNQADADLCADALTTEKYISGTYDTVIFESASQPVRQALQHIQKEEQQHGEGIFNYMQQHGMYQTP